MAKNKNASQSTKVQKRKQARRAAQQQKLRQLKIGLAIAIIAGLSLAAYNYTTQSKPEPISISRLGDNPSKGPDSAVVTIIEYADFGCPSCKQWYQAGIFEQLLAEFGDDLRIEWRDFPVITADSPKAAEAGQCAYDQDMFWEYHDVAFANAPEFSDSALISYAVQIGLDMPTFTDCLTSGKHRQTVLNDQAEAYKFGLRGTPSFVINGQPIVGPNPDLIRQAIQLAIAAAQ